MKEIRGINIPVCCSGTRPRVVEEAESLREQLVQSITEGFTVTHITSSTVNDVMYVYHFLEREVK